MNTDEELREIAEELRIRSNCVGFEDCTGCQALSTKLFGDRFVLCQLDNQDAGYWGAAADLIDRPTCHDLVEHKEDPFILGKRMTDGYFHCSNCDWDGRLWGAHRFRRHAGLRACSLPEMRGGDQAMTTEELDEIAKKLTLCSVDSLGGESLQRALARITKAPATDWRTVMRHIADLIDRGVCENVYRRKRMRRM